MSTSIAIEAERRHSSDWLILTPWIRSTGTDWLVRLVRPRVIRKPRGDSARVKLNIEITRRPITETVPIDQRDQAAERGESTPNRRVMARMIATTVMANGISHSIDSRKLMINRCGGP